MSCSSGGRLHVNVSAIAFVVRHPRVIAMRVMASFDFLVHPAVFHAFMFLFPRPLFFVRSGIRLSSQHCVVQRYHRSILGYWSARRCAQEFLMVSCFRFVSFMFSRRFATTRRSRSTLYLRPRCLQCLFASSITIPGVSLQELARKEGGSVRNQRRPYF